MKETNILLIVAALLLIGCSPVRRANGELVQVDSLLKQGYVDSAYAKLCALPQKALVSSQDSAYFYLLSTQVAYRLYKPVASMKPLDYAISHYSASDVDKRLLAMAQYYKAMLLYDAGRVKDGVVFLKNAEFIAKNVPDAELHHKIFESLELINEESGELQAAMRYARKSLAVSADARNALWQVHACNNLAVLHSKTGNADSASVYIRRCMSMLRYIPQTERKVVLNNIGAYFMQRDTAAARKYFAEIIRSQPMSEAYLNLATLHMQEGDYASADSLLHRALSVGDWQVKDEVMGEMFSLQVQRGRLGEAVATARHLLALKDTVMEKRRENDVKIIQADFDNMKARQEYERRVMLGLVLVVVLSLFGVIVVLYLRYKTFRNKAAIARDQMLIKNYELRLAELQQQGKDKEREIEDIKRRKQKLIDRHRDVLNNGYRLFTDISSGKTTVLWGKADFESFVEYYRLIDAEYVDFIDNGYDGLSMKSKFFLILEHMGRNSAEIMQIMGIADGTVRSIRSRINKRRIGDF